MRLTDMLLTETPRPCLGDAPFTEFTTLCPDPVVIDGTDVYALFMQMAMHSETAKSEQEMNEIWDFEQALGTAGWQMAQFFQHDFSTMGCVAPPFSNFVIEFDIREAMEKAMREVGLNPSQTDLLHLGKYAAVFSILDRDLWMNVVQRDKRTKWVHNIITGPTLDQMNDLPFRWMYAVTTFRKPVGGGIQGPCATWLIPVDADGMLFMSDSEVKGKESILASAALGPRPLDDSDHAARQSDHYAITQGWQVVLPSLLALSFLHTPRTTKDREGYHDLVPAPEPPARMARKYLERNFVPMVKWHTLDISPLRRAVKQANDGVMPSDWKGLANALHVVRGHTATYMSNTYFGRKHEHPITVFRPSYRRGDVKVGVSQKEYRLNVGEA